jgi:hypothetical protein
MRRTFIALALALATANPTGAQSTGPQSKPKCPIARATILGAAVGFGAGAIIAFPVPGVGKNIFEDTGHETAPWITLIGLTIVGAVVGNALARRSCRPISPSVIQSAKLLSNTEVQRLAHTVRLATVSGNATDRERESQWTRPSVLAAATMLAGSGTPSVTLDGPVSSGSPFGCQP